MKASLILATALFGFALQVQAKITPEGPAYPKGKIALAGKTIPVEIAETEELREHGLMFRESMPANEGMLFVFQEARQLNFWMKDTLIPLSIGYFDKDKKLIDIQEMVPAVVGAQEPIIYPSKGSALYALEMNKNWFSKNKIKLGSSFSYVNKSTKGPSSKP